MNDIVKIFELAKEMKMKHTELIPILNELGHDIKGFSKNLTRAEADEMKAQVKHYYIERDLDAKQAIEDARIADNIELSEKLAYDLAYKKADVAKLIGTYYCPIKNRYFIIDVDLTPDELDGKLTGKGYGSIYNLNHDFNVKLGRKGILKPADLADGRKWRKK